MSPRLSTYLLLVALILPLASLRASASDLPPVATLAPTFELRHVGDLVVPFQSGLPLPTYEPQLRARIDLSEGWQYQHVELDHSLTLADRTPLNLFAIEQEGGGAHEVGFRDRMWEITRLPTVANPSPGRYRSGVWYRRRVSLPPTWRERRVLLHCLAANYVADVWVNGKHVGYHEGGFTPFSFDIADYLNWDSANLIALRVDNPAWPTGGASGLPNQELVPYGPEDWWNATGVLRDIYLEALPATALMRADVRSRAVEEGTELRVAVVLRNTDADAFAGRIAATVYPAKIGEANITSPVAEAILTIRAPVSVTDGKPYVNLVAAGEAVLAWELAFTTSELRAWTPAQPNLYVLEVVLRDEDDRLVDRIATQFGRRDLSVRPTDARILLNGRPLALAGVARVEDYPQVGRATTFRDGLRVLLDLRTAKWANANLLHLGPFTNHPITSILADRLGLICWEEIPVSHFDARGLSIQWERRRIARQMFMEMIYQDFNRPSVGFWGACYDSGWGEAQLRYVRDLADIARYLDGSRLIGQSSPITGGPSQADAECDVQGFTLEAESPSALSTEDILSAVERAHAAFPRKPIVITRLSVGKDADSGGEQRRIRATRQLLRAFADRPFVAGCVWWALTDYEAEQGVRLTGLVSRDRRTVRPLLDAVRDEHQTWRQRWENPETPG